MSVHCQDHPEFEDAGGSSHALVAYEVRYALSNSSDP